MRLGTRLLLLLLPIVAAIMALSGFLALRGRQQALTKDTQLETQAYARALAIAFAHAVPDVGNANVQTIINQVNEAPTVYGIVVYDRMGKLLIASDSLHDPTSAPTAALRRVLGEGDYTTFVRTLDGHRVFSVLRALHGPRGTVTGALEVAQPLSSIEEELARTQWRSLLTTFALLGAISLITLGIVRGTITRPLGRLVEASRAIGGGNFAYRLHAPGMPGELRAVAQAFNGMAHGLEQSHAAIARESEERLQLERRLRESEKMAAIGNLAAGLAHEIAAPLNVISGRAEILLTRESDPAGRERQLRIIVHQIHRITAIVRNLLDFARRREVRRVPTALGAVLQGAHDLLEEEFVRAGVQLRYDPATALWVDGDADLLHQVFVNLYLNAIQAMEATEGERHLTVRTSAIADPAAPPTIVVEVRDTGPGIPPDLLGRVFDPFMTTKSRGTGLGLVVARSIVQEHGGDLTVQNADPGPGAFFRVRLPAGPTPLVSATEIPGA